MARPKSFDPDFAVAKAMDLFWTRGYANATPQALCESTGLGRGSLYNAFTSKRDLFALALERYYEEESRKLLVILEGQGSVRERIRRLLLRIVEIDMSDAERRGCFAVNVAVELAPHDEEAKAVVARLFRQTERYFTLALEEGRRSGEIAPDKSPAALASFLLTVATGMRVLCKIETDDTRLHRVVDAAIAAL